MIDPKRPKLRNCPSCGKLFADTGLGICPDCCEKARREEKIVIEYVREHPNTTVMEICKETGAPVKLVTEMVRHGQFAASGGQIFYPCRHCGKPISHGIYCPQCITLLHKAIENSCERAKSQQQPRSFAKRSGLSSINTPRHSLHWMSVREKE